MTNFLANRESLNPLVAVAIGSGQAVRGAVAAGADLLLAFNAGVYRNVGTGSLAAFLPYGNANAQTENLLCTQILPHNAGTPIVAGVFSADPTLNLQEYLLRLKS